MTADVKIIAFRPKKGVLPRAGGTDKSVWRPKIAVRGNTRTVTASAGQARKNIKSTNRFAQADLYLPADAEAGIGIWLPVLVSAVRRPAEAGHARNLLTAVLLIHIGIRQAVSAGRRLIHGQHIILLTQVMEVVRWKKIAKEQAVRGLGETTRASASREAVSNLEEEAVRLRVIRKKQRVVQVAEGA